MGEAARPLVVRHGRLLGYRLLDVADEIDLTLAQTLVDANTSRRGVMTREGARSLVFAAQPLEVSLGSRSFDLPGVGTTLKAEVSARLFEYGAVSISFDVPICEGTSLSDLVPLCDELYETPQLDRLARELVKPLLTRVLSAVRGRHEWDGIEEYTVVYVQKFDGDPPASEVLSSPVLASLVVGEPPSRRLSHGERQDVLKHAFSYFDDDLAVVDWNSAFVLEPSGSRDIPDLLEIATSQLLELRYYDGLFDRELVELSEFAERIDNALKIIGDFYLARVYESAVRRFRIRSWQASIDAKQALLAQAYGLVRGEIESRRSTVLELVVIALIVLEVILAVIRR